MTMEYLGNLGSMIGGLAIFVSLLYLAVETRVNTKAIRSAAYHSSAVLMADSALAFATDRDICALFLKTFSPDRIEELSVEEQLQFSTLAVQLFHRYEDTFAQYRQGAVPLELWEVRRSFARSLLELPAWKVAWEVWKNSPIFIAAFIEEVEAAELVSNPYIGYAGPD